MNLQKKIGAVIGDQISEILTDGDPEIRLIFLRVVLEMALQNVKKEYESIKFKREQINNNEC